MEAADVPSGSCDHHSVHSSERLLDSKSNSANYQVQSNLAYLITQLSLTFYPALHPLTFISAIFIHPSMTSEHDIRVQNYPVLHL